MILYADTSALVKRYVRETGSDRVLDLFEQYETLGTVALTQVEMASAMAKALRMGWVEENEITAAWRAFLAHWPSYTRLPVNAVLLERAASLAWKHSLRAYDAIHLSAGLIWKEAAAEEVIFACFDKHLLQTAAKEGLRFWPENIE